MTWTTLALMASLVAGDLVDGRVHRAPHAGVIAKLGPHLVEVVVEARAIRVWALDRDDRPLPLPRDASLTLRELIGWRRTVVLQRQGDHFEAPFASANPGGSISAELTLRVGRKAHRRELSIGIHEIRHRLIADQ